MGVLGKELAAATSKFETTAAKEAAALDVQLKGRKLQPLKVLTVAEWEAAAK